MLWGTNFPAVRYLVTDPVSLSPAAYAFARFSASALALAPLLGKASSRGALVAGAECGLWIAGGYVVQCLALQGTTAAKGALLAALQVVVVPAAVALVPALRPKGKGAAGPSTKDWACAGAALAGVALLELEGLTAPGPADAIAALQPVFFGISYLRLADAGRRFPSDDDALAMAAAQVVAVAVVAAAWLGVAGEGLDSVVGALQEPVTLAVLAWTALASPAAPETTRVCLRDAGNMRIDAFVAGRGDAAAASRIVRGRDVVAIERGLQNLGFDRAVDLHRAVDLQVDRADDPAADVRAGTGPRGDRVAGRVVGAVVGGLARGDSVARDELRAGRRRGRGADPWGILGARVPRRRPVRGRRRGGRRTPTR